MSELREILVTGAREMGLELSPEQTEKFEEYYRLLGEANKNVNLTSILEGREVAVKHFLDSLSCTLITSFESGMSYLDVGTGAGFPGIPLKIHQPGLVLTLVESVEKKIRFLENLISNLGLEKVTVIHARAEDLGRNPAHRENWERVTARAVASLAVLAEYCLPVLGIGGYFVAMKGPKLDEELKLSRQALGILGGNVEKILDFKLPFTGDERKLVLIRKTGPTPGQYPRRAGVPQKKPL